MHPAQHQHDQQATQRAQNRKRLTIVFTLIVLYMGAEVIGGLLTNSLALLADAGHMFSDAGALGLALFAMRIAQKPASATHTYGYYRTEILAALLNGATLIAVGIYIFVEAYWRLQSPLEVKGAAMMGIALGGMVVNLVALRILSAGRSQSLNIRGAWLHVLSDTLGSVAAVVAGACILAFGWYWSDPAASVLIGLLVMISSWGLIKQAVAVLMEGAPGHIDVDEVRNCIVGVPSVEAVHDLHIWTITTGMVALSVHIVVADHALSQRLLDEINGVLSDRFNIDHTTIQIETEACDQCNARVS